MNQKCLRLEIKFEVKFRKNTENIVDIIEFVNVITLSLLPAAKEGGNIAVNTER